MGPDATALLVDSNDTWEFDGTLWKRVADTGPGPGFAGGLNPRRRECVAVRWHRFGWLSGNTWAWNGKRWTQRQNMGPDPRTQFGFAYDIARKRGVLFGGRGESSSFADTWELFQR